MDIKEVRNGKDANFYVFRALESKIQRSMKKLEYGESRWRLSSTTRGIQFSIYYQPPVRKYDFAAGSLGNATTSFLRLRQIETGWPLKCFQDFSVHCRRDA